MSQSNEQEMSRPLFNSLFNLISTGLTNLDKSLNDRLDEMEENVVKENKTFQKRIMRHLSTLDDVEDRPGTAHNRKRTTVRPKKKDEATEFLEYHPLYREYLASVLYYRRWTS
jgi:hypothetical protein